MEPYQSHVLLEQSVNSCTLPNKTSPTTTTTATSREITTPMDAGGSFTLKTPMPKKSTSFASTFTFHLNPSTNLHAKTTSLTPSTQKHVHLYALTISKVYGWTCVPSQHALLLILWINWFPSLVDLESDAIITLALGFILVTPRNVMQNCTRSRSPMPKCLDFCAMSNVKRTFTQACARIMPVGLVILLD